MTIEEIKEWRKRPTYDLFDGVIQIIDTLLAEVERCHKTLECAGYIDNGGELWKPPVENVGVFKRLDEKLTIANEQLEAVSQKLVTTSEALKRILVDGDYTAPEGMKHIARTGEVPATDDYKAWMVSVWNKRL